MIIFSKHNLETVTIPGWKVQRDSGIHSFIHVYNRIVSHLCKTSITIHLLDFRTNWINDCTTNTSAGMFINHKYKNKLIKLTRHLLQLCYSCLFVICYFQAQILPSLPMILFGVMATIAGILSLTFPETLNTRLPDTIHEAENIQLQTEYA